MQSFDVVCVGNAKIDLFLSIHEANKHLRLNAQTNELCFHSGEKIAVDGCNLSLGGNAANVAVGLSRLGLKSSLYAEIGDDELSHKIINTLKKEDVHTENVKRSKDNECSISVIINFKNERTIFSEHIKRLHDFVFDNLSTKWLYLTSIGNEWKNAYERTSNFVKQTKTLLAFNPGTLQINAGYESIADVLNVTNILFVNKEEATRISNLSPRARLDSARLGEAGKFLIFNEKDNKDIIKQLLIKLQKLGPKIVVITDGDCGSYAIDEKGEIIAQAAIKTKIVEKTGAGDAYSTGFMSAILHGLSIKDAMHWGTLNSASVIEKIGAQVGLLRKEEMEEKLKRISNS